MPDTCNLLINQTINYELISLTKHKLNGTSSAFSEQIGKYISYGYSLETKAIWNIREYRYSRCSWKYLKIVLINKYIHTSCYSFYDLIHRYVKDWAHKTWWAVEPKT